MRKRKPALGDEQAMAFVRVGDFPTAAMADTGTKRSIVDRLIAERAGAKPLGKTGTMNIAGHRLRGELMRVRIHVPRSGCAASVDAFVPFTNQPFRKGLILGMDFMQKAKLVIDAATGEVYCPRR